LQATRTAYFEGNERIRYTTPAIVTASLRLARKLKSREHYEDNWQSQSSTLHRFMHQCISNLYQRVNTPGCADLSLRLFVMCGEVADQTGFEEVSYEFLAQAFTIYEDAISDSRAQFQAVCIIASALHNSRGFSKENYDTLITKAALHGSKLLKKPDQCRAVYLASHLWWVVENSQREEDAANVSFFFFFLFAYLEIPSNQSTAVPRRKTCTGMSPTSPSRGRCLHGHRGVSGALCRNPQPIRLLL
jgi:vacuolar protein sorting-associated protein 35